MTLQGSFSTMPFPDVLQWLGSSRRSGTLWVSLGFEERHFRLEGGDVSAMGSADRVAHDLARLVLARGLIEEPRLQQILSASQGQGSRSLQQILADDGHVDRSVISEAIRAHVRDGVMQVFLWDDGRFVFRAEAERPLIEAPGWDLEVTPALSTEELLIDAMRRLDEWERMRVAFASDYTIVHALGPASDLPAVEALHRIGEPLALVDLCLRLDRPRFEVLHELEQGRRRGLIAVTATPAEVVEFGGPAKHLLEAVSSLLDEDQYDEADALLRTILNLNPTHAEARRLLETSHRAHLEVLYGEMPPYRTPVLKEDRARLAQLGLAPRERYLVDRIDGRRDIAALTLMTPLGERETLRALAKLLRLGMLTLT